MIGFYFFGMPIKTLGSLGKIRVGRVTGKTHIFFFGLSSKIVQPRAHISDCTYVFLCSKPSGAIYIRVPATEVAHVVVAAPTSLLFLNPRSHNFAVSVFLFISTSDVMIYL